MNLLTLVSRHRSALMAFAIFAILFTHAGVSFGSSAADRFCLMGQSGVDLFFFLSGFGLYFSSLKRQSFGHFYLKRFVRIYPAFLVILLIRLLAGHTFTWDLFFEEASTLGFWMPYQKVRVFGWFVSAILLLYLIFPLYIRFFRRRPLVATLLACLVGIALTGAYGYKALVLSRGWSNSYILFFARIPAFFIGVYCGRLSRKTPSGRNYLWFGAFTVLALTVIAGWNQGMNAWGWKPMRESGLAFLPFAVAGPVFCVLMSMVLESAPRLLLKVLGVIGGSTLEIYLLLGTAYAYKWPLAKTLGVNVRWSVLLLMVACVAASIVLHYAITRLVNKTMLGLRKSM